MLSGRQNTRRLKSDADIGDTYGLFQVSLKTQVREGVRFNDDKTGRSYFRCWFGIECVIG